MSKLFSSLQKSEKRAGHLVKDTYIEVSLSCKTPGAAARAELNEAFLHARVNPQEIVFFEKRGMIRAAVYVSSQLRCEALERHLKVFARPSWQFEARRLSADAWLKHTPRKEPKVATSLKKRLQDLLRGKTL